MEDSTEVASASSEKIITFKVDDEMFQKIRTICYIDDATKSEWIRRLISEALSARKGEIDAMRRK